MLKKLLYVFAISIIPVIELRGGVLAGKVLGIPWYWNLLACWLGNILPVPFILIFVRKILEWMKGTRLSRIAEFLEKKAVKKSDKVSRYATFGLFLFVAIPLPGTGAWTGALIASFLEMRLKHSLISIVLGVLAAGIIMTIASYGGYEALRWLT